MLPLNKDSDNSEENSGHPNASPKKAVYVKTFGCQMNEYDSEKMVELLASTHRPVQDVASADVVIVNTCSVREKGEHKLYSLLGSLRDLKQERPELIIGVGGCVAQQEGASISKRFPAVSFVVGTHNLSLVPSLVRGAEQGQQSQVAVNYREDWESLPEQLWGDLPEETGPIAARALIAIQRGCNKNCAFCVVPNTRGPEVSRPIAEIEREVRLKTRLGAKEIVLLGQTVNSYGRDLSPKGSFEELIQRLAAIESVARIRFISPHPAEVRDSFLNLYGSIPQLCPHIHLPMQSGSDRILKLMNRNYRIRRYREIVAAVRSRCPNIAITTDVIVGFPSETEAEFEASLEVMEEVRFNSCYAFRYSRRPNTKAAELFSLADEVPDEVARERLKRLLELQDHHSAAVNHSWLGREVEVLVDKITVGSEAGTVSAAKGRIPENTLVEILPQEGELMQVRNGDIIRARVIHTSSYGLRAVALPGGALRGVHSADRNDRAEAELGVSGVA